MSRTPQEPIGSGFGARSTAREVLEGIDLTGRVAIVTGGYSGIGLETTRALALAGAHVVVPARRPEQASAALAELDLPDESVEVGLLDLGDQASVHRFAEGFLDASDRLDLLVDNAGVMAVPEAYVELGDRRVESTLAINHLGHYALTSLLWPLLSAGDGARVVALSSGGHRLSPIRWDDLDFAQDGYDPWLAYGQAKTANSLFAVHLDRLGQAYGVRAFTNHPGAILTPLQRHMERSELVDRGWIDDDGSPNAAFKTPEQGAATATWAVTSPQLVGRGGVYCQDCDIAPIGDGATGVMPHAVDPHEAERLWALSAELTGVDVVPVTSAA